MEGLDLPEMKAIPAALSRVPWFFREEKTALDLQEGVGESSKGLRGREAGWQSPAKFEPISSNSPEVTG